MEVYYRNVLFSMASVVGKGVGLLGKAEVKVSESFSNCRFTLNPIEQVSNMIDIEVHNLMYCNKKIECPSIRF